MSNQQPLRIGIVGAGGRGVGGYLRYFEDSPIKAEVTAIADPSKINVDVCLKVLTHQSRPPNVYQDWRKMLDAEEGKVEPLCVYNAGGDVVDHQSVHIQYENGVVCNFLMNFNTGGDRSTRNLHIVGTRGRIWGNETDKEVMSHDMATDRVTRHPFERDNTAHSGGNRIHAEEFLRLVAGETHRPVAGVYDAYLSAMLCFAADRARIERRLVGIRYPLEREMELV